MNIQGFSFVILSMHCVHATCVAPTSSTVWGTYKQSTRVMCFTSLDDTFKSIKHSKDQEKGQITSYCFQFLYHVFTNLQESSVHYWSATFFCEDTTLLKVLGNTLIFFRQNAATHFLLFWVDILNEYKPFSPDKASNHHLSAFSTVLAQSVSNFPKSGNHF